MTGIATAAKRERDRRSHAPPPNGSNQAGEPARSSTSRTGAAAASWAARSVRRALKVGAHRRRRARERVARRVPKAGAAAPAERALARRRVAGRAESTTTSSARKTASGMLVRDEHDRRPDALPDLEQLGVEALAGQRVECQKARRAAGRRVARERASDGDALAHAARQLVRIRARRTSARPTRSSSVRARSSRSARPTPASSSGNETLSSVLSPGQQARLLEHEPDALVGVVHGAAVDRDRARVGRQQAADQAQQRALARAIRPDDGRDAAARHLEADAIEHGQRPANRQ